MIIREGRKEDCISIMKMIKELAEYEHMSSSVHIDHTVLERDGFGEEKHFRTFVAENDSNELVGYCLYFYKYSTWQGKFIWMEDFYVKPSFRNKGVGMRLLQALATKAQTENCMRLEFAVLNWNQPSIDFYKRNGAVNLTEKEGWQMFRLTREYIDQLVKRTTK